MRYLLTIAAVILLASCGESEADKLRKQLAEKEKECADLQRKYFDAADSMKIEGDEWEIEPDTANNYPGRKKPKYEDDRGLKDRIFFAEADYNKCESEVKSLKEKIMLAK